ncbi:prepilin-type N-terminal cleavage/methylation domain-containing protein [Kurthia sp. FSL E2-0154]|uniref:prepilin-type N-terminal cleavage/methylation domain-containing protein n=1 Tax=Kurthia sp. FSL E2-0154 TaxID=2921358 RepID=UPI0030FA5168
MRNLLNKKLKNEKGLTLIELLAVIVILAIIALIAIPAIGNIISNSKSKAVLSDATTIISGAKTAIADGVCGAPAEDKSVTCTGEQLKDYVEGLKSGNELVKTDTVKKTATGEYQITYTALNSNNVNEKYMDLLKTAGATITAGTPSKVTLVTQKQLADVMGNK